MQKKDIKVKINMKLWEMVKEKIEMDLGKKFNDVDTILIISLLFLYKSTNRLRRPDNLYALKGLEASDYNDKNYKLKTISIYKYVIERLKGNCPNCTNSELLERALVDFLYLPFSFYTNNIHPIYTFVGSKNSTMQSETAKAVKLMDVDCENTTLIDACCGTGALFLGLDTYKWKSVILNDINPICTNFLNVLKKKPLVQRIFNKYPIYNH